MSDPLPDLPPWQVRGLELGASALIASGPDVAAQVLGALPADRLRRLGEMLDSLSMICFAEARRIDPTFDADAVRRFGLPASPTS